MQLKSIERFLMLMSMLTSTTSVSYPTSVSYLIADYFQNYKHIKQLTLFLCIDNEMDETSNIYEATDTFNVEKNVSKYLNFHQIGRHLMVLGNFLIKGDGNIDAKKFLYTETSSHEYILDTLKCGDFKQGIILDLRCRRGKFLFQQVKS